MTRIFVSILISLFSWQAFADCTESGAETAMKLTDTGTYSDYTTVNNYMLRCVRQFGREFMNSPELTASTKVAIKAAPINFDLIVDQLTKSKYTTSEDEDILKRTKNFAKAASICGRDFNMAAEVPPADPSFPKFTAYCNGIKRLAGMKIEMGITTTAGTVTGTPWIDEAITACASATTPLACAIACEHNPSDCASWGAISPHGTLTREMLNYARNNCVKEDPATTTDTRCKACELTTLITDDLSSCSSTRTIVEEDETDDTKTDDIIDDGTDDKDDTGGDNPVALSDDEKQKVANIANNVAEDMFGNQNQFDYDRGNPNGSINVPGNDDYGSGIDAQGNIDGTNLRAGSVSTGGPGTFNPMLNFPNPGEGIPTGGGNGQANTAGAGGGPGAFGGGGLGAGQRPNLNNQQANNRPQGKKRPRGSSSFEKIKNGIGGNSFLTGNSAPTGRNTAEENKEKLDKKYKDRIAMNRLDGDDDNSTISNAFNRGLNQAGIARRNLMIKASFFPGPTEVYVEINEKSDHLNEKGQSL